MMSADSKYVFETSEDAVKWAVEVLRRRRLPATTTFWKESMAEAEWVEQAWEGTKNLNLPQGRDERMELALKVMEGLGELELRNREAGKLVQLWAWGDWADEGRLAAALAIQEKCRREGVRVRLSYRYTYAQLGQMLGCDKKVAWRKVQEGLRLLGEILGRAGVVMVIEGPEMECDNFKKHVYSDEFKN